MVIHLQRTLTRRSIYEKYLRWVLTGRWSLVEVEPMSIKREYDFPEVGEKDMYLLHHEEIESLAKNIPGVKRIRFFMTFGQSY